MADDFVIDVKGLNKSFADKHVVKDVDLRVKRGEIFGFLGPNGSGKTTTLRMICGLLTPDSGSGHCLGYDILRDATQIKMRVGYMTQNFSLYEDMTVYENMRFVGKVYQLDRLEERIKQTLEQLSFGSRVKQLAGSMSGGWKQRLALACCLLHDPQVLLLDEPTAGVDPKARRDFWDQIHVMASQGITTLVTTHYMDEAERCTRLAYIAYGTLLAEGKMHEIIDQSALYAWAVSGDGLSALAAKLKALPDIDEVAVFGEVLHVTGYDKARLEQAIAPYRTAGFVWKEIKPSIEDVFISLVGKSEDNF